MPSKQKNGLMNESIQSRLKNNTWISESTVHRLSQYIRTLQHLQEIGTKTVSSEMLAKHNGVTAAQVRKDLSCFGAFGRRGLGYNVHDLRVNIKRIMGLDRTWIVALAGVGNIGRALIDYAQFRMQGFKINIAFDRDPAKIGKIVHGVAIRDEANLERDIRDENVDIAVIAVPALAAQNVVDKCISGGVNAILNFAPVNLKVPDGVFIRNENMAIEIEALSFALTNPNLVRTT